MVTIEERRIPDANFQRLLNLLFGNAQATTTAPRNQRWGGEANG